MIYDVIYSLLVLIEKLPFFNKQLKQTNHLKFRSLHSSQGKICESLVGGRGVRVRQMRDMASRLGESNPQDAIVKTKI